MKIVNLLIALFFVACATPTEKEQQVLTELKQEEAQLQAKVEPLRLEVKKLSDDKTSLQNTLQSLQEDEAVMKAQKDSKGVHYILHCSIRQIHYSLSIKKQFSDAVNEEEFDLVTDKDSYDHTNEGTDLFDSFRVGSAVFKGSLGSWRIKVLSKRIAID